MNINNILETIRMIEAEKLDIRTITMGISLIDCIDSDGDRCREKIYNKIVISAKDLVKVGRGIENEFGIPIVNKRVSVTLISIIAGATDIGMINNKTTAVRVIPAPGCKVGDMIEFGGLLGRAPVMEVNKYSSELFIKRGGKIPAPIHSFKN